MAEGTQAVVDTKAPLPPPPAPAKVTGQAEPGATKDAPAEDQIAKGLEVIAERDRAHREAVKKFEASRHAHESELAAARELLALRAEYKKTRDPRLGAKILEYEDAKEVVRDFAVKLANEAKPKTAEDRVAALEAKLAEMRESAEKEAASRARAEEESRTEAVRSNHRTQMSAFVAEKESEYPNLAAQDNPGRELSDIIWNHWTKTFDKDTGEGEVLASADAAIMLEMYLDERAKRAEAIRAKHKKQPEPAPTPKPPEVEKQSEVKAERPKSGEEAGPEAKEEQGAAEFDLDKGDLDKLDPDSLSDEETHRLALALFQRGLANK